MRGDSHFYGWYVVAATFAILFAGFGTAYAFGAFFLPIAETFAAARADVAAIFAYAAALIFLTGAVSGPLADRFGPRPVVFFGACAIVSGLLLGAHARSLLALTICFMSGVGIGVGCVYVPSLGAVQRWFFRRRAFASGIAVTGIGVGTVAMPLLASLLLQTLTWREVFVVNAGLVALCCLPAIYFLEAEPARRGQHPDGDDIAVADVARPRPPTSLLATVQSRAFAQLYAAQLAMSFVVMLPFVHLVPSAQDLGIPAASAVRILGLVGVGSVLGRVFIGSLADRCGRSKTLVGLFLGTGVTYLGWYLADDYTALSAFALVYGTLYGGFIALMPALLADHFAGPRLSTIIGLQYTSAAFGSLLGPITMGYVFDRYGSYSFALVSACGLCIAAAALVAAMPAPAPETAAREI